MGHFNAYVVWRIKSDDTDDQYSLRHQHIDICFTGCMAVSRRLMLLRDSCRWGAKFGCAVLLLSLVMLAIANFIGAPLWAVTLAAACVLVAGNL
jgi:hypothetical protein